MKTITVILLTLASNISFAQAVPTIKELALSKAIEYGFAIEIITAEPNNFYLSIFAPEEVDGLSLNGATANYDANMDVLHLSLSGLTLRDKQGTTYYITQVSEFKTVGFDFF